MRFRKMRDIIATAALLLALAVPSSAHGQSDGFFNNADGVRNGGNGGSWNDISGGAVAGTTSTAAATAAAGTTSTATATVPYGTA